VSPTWSLKSWVYMHTRRKTAKTMLARRNWNLLARPRRWWPLWWWCCAGVGDGEARSGVTCMSVDGGRPLG